MDVLLFCSSRSIEYYTLVLTIIIEVVPIWGGLYLYIYIYIFLSDLPWSLSRTVLVTISISWRTPITPNRDAIWKNIRQPWTTDIPCSKGLDVRLSILLMAVNVQSALSTQSVVCLHAWMYVPHIPYRGNYLYGICETGTWHLTTHCL